MRAYLLVSLLCVISHCSAYAAPLQGKIQLEDNGDTTLNGGAASDDSSRYLPGGVASEDDSRYLPAGAAFTETVDPVPPGLRPHKLFSSITLPVSDKEDRWYQIPLWRAGLYRREKQIDHLQTGDRESISKVDHLYGMQVDKKGGIWHHDSWPSITKLTLDGYSEYKMIDKYEPIRLSTKEFCVKISSTNIDVDDKTGKITRVAKQEEFDSYFPAGPGRARGECRIQGYSIHGRVNTEVDRCSVEEVLIQPFKVLNTFRGKDLRESFKRFLIAHDLADLVPDSTSSASSTSGATLPATLNRDEY